ncbi:MAG: hypothetical protein JSW28_10610 [Thermoplasmata archaeon]|nr:MAG: hypothetical protein JSW28_10610 [Thermoplasmata archaeon]
MPKKSLIDTVAEDREAKDKEEDRRNALREKVAAWRKKGWVTAPIDNVVEGNLDEAEKELELYEGALKKLSELNRQFRALDARGFEYDAQTIANKLNDPRQINFVEKGIIQLKGKIDARRREQEKKRMQLAEYEMKRYAEERKRMELEARRRYDEVKTLELETRKSAQEKERLTAQAMKLKEEHKRAKIDAKKAEADRKKMELETQRKEEERKKLELELQAKREEEKRRLDFAMQKTAEQRRTAEAEAKTYAEQRRRLELEVQRRNKELRTMELQTRKKVEESRKLELEVKKREEERKKLEREAKKREEEQRRLAAKKKKEEERMAKLGQEAMMQWEKEMTLKATNYIATVDEMMRSYKPEYSPLGLCLWEEEWKIDLKYEQQEIIGTIYGGIMKELLKLVCVYDREIKQKFIADANKVLVEDVNRASKSKQFLGKCYVIDKIDDKTVISTIEQFKHPNCSIYIYSLDDEKLIYNEKDMKTMLFSEWFKAGGEPKSMNDILHDLADKNNEFSGKDLREKLKFKKKELDKFIESCIENNEIYRLVGVEDRFGLVKK